MGRYNPNVILGIDSYTYNTILLVAFLLLGGIILALTLFKMVSIKIPEKYYSILFIGGGYYLFALLMLILIKYESPWYLYLPFVIFAIAFRQFMKKKK